MKFGIFHGTLMALLVLVAAPPPAQADAAAWVVRTNGSPAVTRAGKKETLARGRAINPGDVVETDAASKVKILLADDSILAVGPGSRFLLTEFALAGASRKVRLKVLVGKFKLAVSKFFGGPTDYEVTTPTAVAGVRGTVLWGDTQLDAICALEGNIEVRSLTGPSEGAKLSSGQCVGAMGHGETKPLAPSAQAVAGYLKEVTLD